MRAHRYLTDFHVHSAGHWMPPMMRSTLPSRSKNRSRVRDRSRLMLVVASIGGVLATGLLTTREIEIPRSPAAAVIVPSDDEVYMGSILYMPRQGTFCRQVLFDNRTGRLSDNGMVDCESAIYRSASSTPNARARAISEGFRER
jgi:hypothetical protein